MVDLEPVRGPVEVLLWVAARKRELKDLEANARGAVEEAMGENEVGELDGKPVISWSRYKKRQLNQTHLKDAHPDLVEEYMETKEQRTFKIIEDS